MIGDLIRMKGEERYFEIIECDMGRVYDRSSKRSMLLLSDGRWVDSSETAIKISVNN